MQRAYRRIGVLVAGADMVLEKDFANFIPAGISFHVGRLNQDCDAKCAANTSLGKMVVSAESAASLVAMAEPEAMIFACSSASFYKGPGWDRKVAAKVRKGGGVPATTTATAIAKGLKALGAKRTVLVTPYPDATNRAEIAFLKGNGVDVVDYSTFGCRLSTDVPKVTPAEIRRRVLEGLKKSAGLRCFGGDLHQLARHGDCRRLGSRGGAAGRDFERRLLVGCSPACTDSDARHPSGPAIPAADLTGAATR